MTWQLFRIVQQFSHRFTTVHCVRLTHTHSLTHTIRGQRTKPMLKMYHINTPHFQEIFTPELKRLLELFTKYKHELRLAGGPVRDLLVNKVPTDIDLATTATPAEMKEMFELEGVRMLNMGGEKHGTITARINDKENFEITTLRIDVRTDGRRAEVEWTRDWQIDALRRDLTINAMFLGFDGTLYDYFDGKTHLANHHVQFVGSAEDRIQEDYLRILRYFRFYGKIARQPNEHEDSTLKAIRDNAHGLECVAGERIWVEVKKIFLGNHAPSLIKTMIEVGLGPSVGLQGELDFEELQQVWTSCKDLDPEPMTLVAALLTKEEQIVTLHNRVKMSKDEHQLGLFIVQHRNHQPTSGLDMFGSCQDLWCDNSASVNKVQNKICELLKYRNDRLTLQQFSKWTPPKFPVSGVTLLEIGVPKGPELAKKLQFLRKKWRDTRYKLTEEELIQFLKK